ncbi:MAG: hypothetical protein DI582_00820 [Azospirillum brasilense]|nr:MAG: hypothetical protein DI582_00820 [Azospirillum brasilense]
MMIRLKPQHLPTPDLVQEQFPALAEKLGRTANGAKALDTYRVYVTTPVLSDSWHPNPAIERIAQAVSTAQAGIHIVEHVATNECKMSPVIVSDAFNKVNRAYIEVRHMLDTLEVWHHEKENGALLTTSKSISENYRMYNNLAEHLRYAQKPRTMRLALKKAIDSASAAHDALLELADAPAYAPQGSDGRYCLRQLTPELAAHMQTVITELRTLDGKFKDLNEPVRIHPDKDVPHHKIPAEALKSAYLEGKLVDLAYERVARRD